MTRKHHPSFPSHFLPSSQFSMPGLNLASHISPSKTSVDVEVVQSALSFPPKALAALEASPVNANVILPILLKARESEQKTGLVDVENTWFICYDSPARTEVLFIASCTKGMMGRYPIFIFTTTPRRALTIANVDPSMQALCLAMDATISRERVYSVFAVDIVAAAFSTAWTKLTGIERYLRPYYDATVSYCTKQDIQPVRQHTLLPGIEYHLCQATEEDIPEIGKHCEMFASESVCWFVLILIHAC